MSSGSTRTNLIKGYEKAHRITGGSGGMSFWGRLPISQGLEQLPPLTPEPLHRFCDLEIASTTVEPRNTPTWPLSLATQMPQRSAQVACLQITPKNFSGRIEGPYLHPRGKESWKIGSGWMENHRNVKKLIKIYEDVHLLPTKSTTFPHTRRQKHLGASHWHNFIDMLPGFLTFT